MKIVISYFKDDIVRVFIGEALEEPISTGAVCLDKIILGSIKVKEEKENIIITGEKVITIVNKFTTDIVFKDLNNNTICEDFQPTFKDENGCIYITKTNDCIAYYG
ncbi:MAG: alpha-glucosidase, partial [Clostridium sp.]